MDVKTNGNTAARLSELIPRSRLLKAVLRDIEAVAKPSN